MALTIVSLNVNGLKDRKKRHTFFHWLKMNNFDFCLLQETHCDSDNEIEKWRNEWAGKAYFSLGTNMSKGVATLIKPNLDVDVCDKIIENNGRYLKVDIKIDDFNCSVINVYSPNNPAERRSFFKFIDKEISEIRHENLDHNFIIGGDFNCVINPALDRRNEQGHNVKKKI